VSINKAVDDLSSIEKDYLFTVLEEKLDYPANMEESVRKKVVKAAISQIGTLQRWFKAHLRQKYMSEEESPFVKHAFLQQQDWDMFVQETNSPSSQQLSQEMKQKSALHNKPHKTGRKGYRGKRKEWEEEDAKLVAEGKLNPWDQFSGHSIPYLRPRVGKKKKNTSEGSRGITFSNPAVVGVADRVKTLAAQGSDGSFSGVREDDILTTALETPEHRGRVQGVSSSLGRGKGFDEEFAGMYRKKRNKRSFKSIVHALRLSGINILKNALLPSQLPVPISSSKEEDMDGIEEEDGHDREEEHAHDNEEDGIERDHWNANGDEANEVHSDSRSPMLVTIDKLTEPTTHSLLDGTVELALAKVLPSKKACHSVPVQDGYVVVQPPYVWANASQYPMPVPIDGGDVATLAEALVQRIQCPKDRIIIPPMTRHPNPEAATGSRGTTSDGGAAANCQQEKAQQQQQQISKTTQQER
jgi:hypothetical protein